MAIGLNPIAGYQQSDTDTTALSPQYYGFLEAANSAWYISQYISTGGVSTFRYFAGSGLANYQASWTNRATLVYDYYSNIFKNC
jgi:hypothetical protein